MEESNLFDIIDARVMNDANKEEIIAVADLAKKCLNLNGKNRPTMKEVAIQLESVQKLRKGPTIQLKNEDVGDVITELQEQMHAISTSSMSGMESV